MAHDISFQNVPHALLTRLALGYSWNHVMNDTEACHEYQITAHFQQLARPDYWHARAICVHMCPQSFCPLLQYYILKKSRLYVLECDATSTQVHARKCSVHDLNQKWIRLSLTPSDVLGAPSQQWLQLLCSKFCHHRRRCPANQSIKYVNIALCGERPAT